MTRYLLAALLALTATFGALAWGQGKRLAAAHEQVAAMRRETAALRAEAAQAREAREVAEAWAMRYAAQVAEYADLRGGAMKDGDDAPAPAVVLRTVERLRARR